MTAHEIFSGFLWVWIGVACATFIILRFTTAPYGRHNRPKWGPQISNKWGWVIMELPTLIVFPALFLSGPKTPDTVSWVIAGCYLAHYFNRVLIFPFRIRTKGKKMPVVIMGSAIFFNLMNAGGLGYWLGWDRSPFSDDYLLSIPFIVGLLVFLLGASINIGSDNRLLNLRKDGETGYKVPFGGFFKWISCPNHFGEMVEWTGFAIMCGSLAGWAFAIWTIANLFPRALDHHQWYRSKFEDYPENRKAVIPFVI